MAQDDTARPSAAEAGDSLGHLSRLSAWVAHEVNNSLGGIHTSLALLQRLIPADHPHYRFVGAIEREIARSSALTERLQQSYAFDAERTLPVPLAVVLSDAIRALTPLGQARNVTLSVAPTTGIAADSSCSALMGAAIRHLLQHAIESSAAGKVICVQTTFSAGLFSVTVPIGDTTASIGTWPMAGPRGLALSLVRQVCQTLNGELHFDTTEGQDGAIRLSLPLTLSTEAMECRSKE